MKTYNGTCHCGSIAFAFAHEEITSGLRCNCSICRRKGAAMSDFTLQPNQLEIKVEGDNLSLYQFDSNIAKHYFCKTCGIYPFHETLRKPGQYRVNLGCIDEIDTNTLNIAIFDGKGI